MSDTRASLSQDTNKKAYDSLINTTYNVQNNMFGSLHTTDL